jgi:MOSC N-terminal beta barrel domain
MVLPTLSRIEIFPVKSLDGVVLQDVTVLPSGALKGDRQYALLDVKGQFVNGKNNTLVHRLRTAFSEDLTTITLRCQALEQCATFSLVGDSFAPRVRQFQQRFIQFRQAQLPNWANRARFKHFYKLAVNTRLAQDTQSFQVKIGDEIKILPEKNLQHF